MNERVEKAARFAEAEGFAGAEIACVLGSGLAPLAESVVVENEVPTASIPGWPPSTVAGHAGKLIIGTVAGRRVIMLAGRLHGYEGYDLALTTLPIRVMVLLGARFLVITNGAGGINPNYGRGAIMVIRDHLNLQGRSPLTGPNCDAWGPRFPDMTEVYDAAWRGLVADVGKKEEIALESGVYASVPGPQYETPAEINMLRLLGADAVGMSSVPEAIVARHMGARVLGLSVITNPAAGMSGAPLAHADVVAEGERAGERVTRLVEAVIGRMSELDDD